MDGGPVAAALGGGTASPGRITLWGIEVFVATAEERSISAAARRLGVSASAVSQQLTNLEAALAVTLLVRNARPVTLTPAGEAFRRRAQSILNEAAQARAELLVAGAPTLRRLRFGVIDDLEADVTPQLLVRMAARLEGCQFLLETGASHGLYDQLEAEALDVIVTAEMGEAPPWAEVHPILTEDFVVAAPKGMVDPSGDVLAQLKAQPLVPYTTRHHMGRLIATHLAQQNLTLAHRFELDSYHAILALVGQGVGWTILPPLALIRARRLIPGLELMDLPFAPVSRRIVLMARQGILDDVPGAVASELRALLREVVVEPAVAAYPHLSARLALV
ncbi:DNA-binding transcriptional regulator, LysR family [Pseudooceanicola nitratireducens]|jgi:DNA-binding transcriptional LysR family regulator|uniref:DNA-binding transcriptional regulator, LysR family n=1 Tax=Pseudooceanicola nitratireducens TaxID=517719 RepID=A0A1I1KP10_9RHOB|nr:LysR family transcriptional regulator [Pseudooceanicola nitratireducens]MEC7794957.1 LysR family transcriptional regulator [Pseudomonadota bacterium]SEJ44123.1 DNA-binding transcriptional regulator, LysR family [Pseudooceanicola nitratireducens]SFC62441.1 DNA-binding transcriptional regulator, LysR family [Pseudooceanicola nitratireducens]